MNTYLIPTDFSSKNQEHVQILQQALIALGYADNNKFIGGNEYDTNVKEVIQEFREDHSLSSSIRMNSETINELNSQLEELYRVCGKLTDDYGMPIEGAEVIVNQETFNGTSKTIGKGISLENGIYCVYINIDNDFLNKQGELKSKKNVKIEIYQDDVDPKFTEKNYLIQGKENILNITSSDLTYKGKSIYKSYIEILDLHDLTKVVKNVILTDLSSQTGEKLIDISSITGIEIEILIKLFLAEVLESKTNGQFNGKDLIFSAPISSEVFFAYLYQGLPSNLPSQLFTDDLENLTIGNLTGYIKKISEKINIGLCLMTEQDLNNALFTACKNYIIDNHKDIWIGDNVISIDKEKSNVALNSELLAGGVKITDIIDEAETKLNSGQKKEIATIISSHIKNFNELKTAIIELKEDYNHSDVDKLLLTFQISQVVRNYKGLIKKLLDEYKDTEFIKNGIRFIATITLDEWITLIEDSFPADFESATEYAQYVYENAQKLYPEISTISKLKANSGNTKSYKSLNYAQDIEDVLLSNPDKNILTDKFENFNIDNNLKSNVNFVKEFRALQRVHRMAPSSEVAATLLENGISSAAQVYYMGLEQFETSFKNSLTKKEILNVYAVASGTFAKAIAAFTTMEQSFHSQDPYALQPFDVQTWIENLQPFIPNIEELFGNQDHCDCDHDSSVFSPAAYLAEVLNFLEEHTHKEENLPKKSILDYLKDRRADICNINLNSQNTNTMLPYIDLVCEVLEEEVIKSVLKQGKSFTRLPSTCQSTLSSEELSAAPQHILSCNVSNLNHDGSVTGDVTAYDILKPMMYPMYAPINLEQTESRAYLSKMGISRHELMEAFQINSSNPSNVSIAAEYFGLTNLEQLVVTAHETNGYNINQRNEAWTKTIGSGNVNMTPAEFMMDTRLSALETLDIAKTNWVDISIITTSIIKNKREIQSNKSGYDRAHRFIRLWRKSNWKIWELDLLLRNNEISNYISNNTDNLNASTLYNLYLFSLQQKKLGLSCESLLAFYGEINRSAIYENGEKQKNLYEKLFLNFTVENPVNINLNEIKNNPNSIVTEDDDDLIAACLSINKEEYDFLENEYPNEKPYTKNLKYLNYLYRQATLSKKLKISIPELITILKLIEIDAYKETFTLTEIDKIISKVNLVKESKLSAFEYEYLTKYWYDTNDIPQEANDISQEAISLKLTEEQRNTYKASIKTIVDEFDGMNSIHSNFLKSLDTTNPELAESDFASYVASTGIFKNPQIQYDFNKIIEIESRKEENEIKLWMATYAPSMNNINNYFPDSIESQLNRYINAIDYLTYESKFASDIKDSIAKFFDLSSSIVNTLLRYKLDENSCLLKQILVPKVDNKYKIDDILTLFHKISLFIKKNSITPQEFEILIGLISDLNFNWFNFKTNSDIDTVTHKIKDFLNLSGIIALHKKYGTIDGKSLLDVYADKDLKINYNEFLANISKITSWKLSDFNFLSSNECFKYTRSDYFFAKTYLKIERCIQMLDKMKVQAITIIKEGSENIYNGWCFRLISPSDEKKQNSAIKSALKAFYDKDTWLKELATIQKPIRETKADVLSSYLIATSRKHASKPIQDKYDLYNHFLLDTEMSADVKTSRIVQATCAVQLFMQRIFLNLEDLPSGIIKEKTCKQWDWMKRYRLWEAGFKVFLYPENYIEPELRDDKSPFFKEMEEELNQNDITEEHVENVYINYLHKLHEVSNLIVIGTFWEEKDDSNALLHVVGRSRNTPYQYYYRNYNNAFKSWTCWEKIELDIKGDVVVPLVYKKKLHLFWISVVEKVKNEVVKDPADAPTKYTEIQLEWSVLKNNKWSPIKTSRKKLIHNGHYPKMYFSLAARPILQNGFIQYISLHVYTYWEEKIQNFKHSSFHFGTFRFNGDVYSVVSNLFSFDQGNMDDSKFNELKESLDIDELPNTTFNKYSIDPTNGKLFSTRLYANKKNEVYEVYLNILKNPNVGHDSKILFIADSIEDANLVQMLHDKEDEHNNLAYTHFKYPFFYQDSKLSFFIKPSDGNNNKEADNYILHPFYHAGTKKLIEELTKKGIAGFLDRNIQGTTIEVPKNYQQQDEQGSCVNAFFSHEIKELIDFSFYGAYSQYNWELFFHAPLYIACKLSQNQKYEEAMQWFHYIFNPTDRSEDDSPQKFWVTKPFNKEANENSWKKQTQLLFDINDDAQSAIAQWLNDPFNPHLIARTRTSAFQKTVVMKYIENLINWADNLFRQDTMESNNEAAQLYILAYQILGKKPLNLPENNLNTNIQNNFNIVIGGYYLFNEFGDNFIYNVGTNQSSPIYNPNTFEYGTYSSSSKPGGGTQQHGGGQQQLGGGSYLTTYPAIDPPIQCDGPSGDNTQNGNGTTIVDVDVTPPPTLVEIVIGGQPVQNSHFHIPEGMIAPRLNKFFCIPYNEQILRYWDIVEDRLFKLRNSMNIEGITRELPLFAPPIDPALLVRAAAAGLSIADALSEINAPVPYYRFRVILQKAIEFTGEVKQLGEKLLSALEKRDAETLSLVRSVQEVNMQQAIMQVRKLQIAEAKKNIDAIKESIKNTKERKEWYESRELMNKLETDAYNLNSKASLLSDIVAVGHISASIASFIPDFNLGAAGWTGSPLVSVQPPGGSKISSSISSVMTSLSYISQALDKKASLLLTKSSYKRRKEEWEFQGKMAGLEIKQLDHQLLGAEIRLSIAEQELKNIELQIEQSKSISEFYKEKFTNEQLYNWMITEISKVYLNAYKLAYDMAKKAESCYRNELGIFDDYSPYIKFGYWDSLKQGLLAGDRLSHALHRLDAAYINENKRTLELTKHISLAEMFPDELIELIAKKDVILNLPEYIFDMDYPGHYLRRIKSISVTIPNVAGPNTNVSFMLSLQSAKVRKNEFLDNGYNENNNDDSRFSYQTVISQSICTSSAINDSGLFELNFGDERYLPFEGAGVISKWKLSFPAAVNQFDLSTVSDVILHIKYTALNGGEDFAEKASLALESKLPKTGIILFNPKQDFPDAWNLMDSINKKIEFKINQLPFYLRDREDEVKVKNVSLILVSKNKNLIGKELNLKRKNGGQLNLILGANTDDQNPPNPILQGDMYIYFNNNSSFNPDQEIIGDWELILNTGIEPEDIEDIIIVFSANID